MPKIKKNVNIVKSRYWALVAYPDSLPKNWQEILIATGIPCCVSPLHDADFNADDTQKKAHYHILLCYGNTTTYNTIKKITDSLNATIPQVVNNLKGYYRYLTHQDNPEKAQYDKADIISLNGFCVGDYVELTKGYYQDTAYRTGYATTTDGVTTVIYAIPTAKEGATTVYTSTTASTGETGYNFNGWTMDGNVITDGTDDNKSITEPVANNTATVSYVANW